MSIEFKIKKAYQLLIKNLNNIFKEAAIEAIRKGIERITRKIIENLKSLKFELR